MPDKPHITYPCPWTYRIIGERSENIIQAVEEIIPDRDSYDLIKGNVSKHGNYVSLYLKIIVLSEKQKDHYKSALMKSKGIIIVL
jgi:putative lipoic acid-binding regulatory protein